MLPLGRQAAFCSPGSQSGAYGEQRGGGGAYEWWGGRGKTGRKQAEGVMHRLVLMGHQW